MISANILTGYNKASESREDRQRKLTQDKLTSEYLASTRENDLSEAELRLDALTKKQELSDMNIVKDKLYKAFNDDETFGNNSLYHLNEFLKEPSNQQSVGGVTKVSMPEANDNRLKQPEVKSMTNPVVIHSEQYPDGVIADLDTVKASRGYSAMKIKRDTELNRLQYEADEQESLSNIRTPEEAMSHYVRFGGVGGISDSLEHTNRVELENLKQKNKLAIYAAKDKLLKDNPEKRDSLKQMLDAFLGTFKEGEEPTEDQLVDFYSIALTKLSEGTSAVREDKDVNTVKESLTSSNEGLTNEQLRSKEIDAMTALSNTDKKTYERVNKTVANMQSRHELHNNIGRILSSETVTQLDKNALVVMEDSVRNIFGSQTPNTFNNIDFSTRTGMMLANYIKELSGTAAADAEVKRLLKNLLSSDLHDDKSIIKAMNTFQDELLQLNITSYKNVEKYMHFTANKFTERYKSDSKPTSKTDWSKFNKKAE